MGEEIKEEPTFKQFKVQKCYPLIRGTALVAGSWENIDWKTHLERANVFGLV